MDIGTHDAVFNAPVHPVAALFPMMTDEELDDLAADIKANGQVHPIVLDQHGTLLDGRNRREACRRAGVAPDVIRETLDDPVAFILSANMARRHLTKGQIAMLAVESLVETTQVNQHETATAYGVSQARIAQAHLIRDYASDQVDGVISGAVHFDNALEEARTNKRNAESAEAQFARLQKDAPDLAALVTEGRMTLAEARAAATERQRAERQYRDATTELLFKAVTALDPGEWHPLERGREIAGALHLRPFVDGSPLTPERLTGCVAVLEAVRDALAERIAGSDGTTQDGRALPPQP
jgi:ParB-like chromosome segregation protein Spo0J